MNTNPLDVHGSELVAFGADEVHGHELAAGDIIRHYVSGSTLLACRIELDETPTAPGARRVRLVYGSGAVRSTMLDDASLYERVRVPETAGQVGAVRVELVALAAAAALAAVPVVFVASLVGAIAGAF